MNAELPEIASPSPRRKRYLVYVGGVVAIVAGVIFGALSVRMALSVSPDEGCKANLQRIGFALWHYHERCGSYPPAYVLSEQGERWHSWRVLLLPDLGYKSLYAQYRFDEPWDGPHNRRLIKRMPAVYGCPADGKRGAGITNYFAVVGPQTAWPEHYALRDEHVTDPSSWTMVLIESVDEGIAWLEPRDLKYADLKNGAYHSNPRPSLRHTEKMRLLLLDGAVFQPDRSLSEAEFRGFCTPAGGRPFPGVNWQLPIAEAAEFQTVPRPASELPKTTVMPHMNSPLVSNQNVVYCANFQLAWDRLREDIVGAPIELEGAPDMARELNLRVFPKGGLAEDAYVALAGQFSDGIVDRIRSQMTAKFPAVVPRLLRAPGTDGLMAYAYLQKRLPFAVDFDRLKQPLKFYVAGGETEVASFGIERFTSDDPREESLREQVTVLDYVGPDDLILQLNTKEGPIVLAKVPRAATLAEAVAAVQARVARPLGRGVEKELQIEERVLIPLLSLFVERQYTELIGRKFTNPGFTGSSIDDAIQLIRFQLDESGAILEAEAAIITIGIDERPQPRQFVFDRPFLLYLQEPQAEQPYFVMWVENAEVLVPHAANARAPATAKWSAGN